MDSPSQIGAAAEREVAYALEQAGWTVYLPVFAPHVRVDFVAIDPSGSARRLQVKSSRLVRDGTVITFRTCSNTGNQPSCYKDEIDAFGVWCPELSTAYLVPIEGTPSRRGHLRLAPAANGQSAGIRFAEDYEIRPVTAAKLAE